MHVSVFRSKGIFQMFTKELLLRKRTPSVTSSFPRQMPGYSFKDIFIMGFMFSVLVFGSGEKALSNLGHIHKKYGSGPSHYNKQNPEQTKLKSKTSFDETALQLAPINNSIRGQNGH